MFNVQGASKHTCGVLAVLCGKTLEDRQKQDAADSLRYPFPDIVSSGRLEVRSGTQLFSCNYDICVLLHVFLF